MVTALLLCACGRHAGSSGQTPCSMSQARPFPALQIPSIYSDPSARTAYAAEHYWDSFFSGPDTFPDDSVLVNGVARDEIEEHFATFVTLVEDIDIQSARRAMDSFFRKVEAFQKRDTLSGVFDLFASLAEKYLYDPNSPCRSEDLYRPYVEGLSRSEMTPSGMVPAYTHDAGMCALNAIGAKAADFVFRDISGRNHSLYGIKADHTLLFFSNPGCEACKSIIETLRGNEEVTRMVASGRLAVVNVYIDEDIEAWKGYQDYYPDEWFNGYDPSFSIRQDIKYNVRAIPSLYLLDADKTVLMKDAPENRIFTALSSIAENYSR